MATVIDELIVVLGLDASKFSQGQKDAVSQWAKTREAAKKHTDNMAKDTDMLSEAVTGLGRRLLGLGALFLGGLGVKNFTDNIKALSLELTNLSRAATNAGTSAQTMKTYMNVGAAIGADPAQIAASMTALRDQIAQFRVFATGNTAVTQFLSKMGLTAKDFDTPEGQDAALKKMNRYADQLRKGGVLPPEINAFFGAGGMTKDMSNLLQLDPKKFDELQETFKKYAPTDQQIQRAKSLQEQIAKVDAAFGSLGNKILYELAPPLENFLKLVEKFINLFKSAPAENIPDIQKQVEEDNRKHGIGGPSPLQQFRNWFKGSSLSSLNPIGSANAAIPPADQPFGSGPGKFSSAGSGGLAGDRAKYARELEQNPALREKIMGIAAGENMNETSNLAVIESMMNRASARGTSLEEAARLYGKEKNGYYAGYNPGALRNEKTRTMIEANMQKALGGSNVSNYATDNSSGSLAVRDRVSGAFVPTANYNGESFFSPGNRGRGSASRASYERWRQGMESGGDAFTKGSDPIPYGDWLTNASTRNLMRSANITTNNNRTSSQTQVGDITVNTQATDAYGIARDLKPYLENNKTTTPFNYGPN